MYLTLFDCYSLLLLVEKTHITGNTSSKTGICLKVRNTMGPNQTLDASLVILQKTFVLLQSP